jgi:hypothetical protein
VNGHHTNRTNGELFWLICGGREGGREGGAAGVLAACCPSFKLPLCRSTQRVPNRAQRRAKNGNRINLKIKFVIACGSRGDVFENN